MIDALCDLCEFDPFIVLMLGAVIIAVPFSILLAVILWPLEPIDDAMDYPFGDMPQLPPREQP